MKRNRTKHAGGQAPVRGYDNWTIGELRHKLGRRDPDQLEQLLEYEKSTRRRKGAIEALERALEEKRDRMAETKDESEKSGAAEPRIEKILDRVRSGVKAGVKKMRELTGMSSEDLGAFSRESFMERLSEFLEHERGGAKIYDSGLEKDGLTDDQRERLQGFREQTQRHIEILSKVISDLGGDPNQLSESAELDKRKADGLLETDCEGEVGLLNFFQNLLIAELVDHMNWEFITKVRSEIDDEEVVRVLDENIGGVEDEEDEHFRWAQRQVEELSMRQVFSGAESMEGESGDEGESDREAA